MITNYLQPASFTVTIKRLPNVQFFTQRALLPALVMTPVERGSPLSSLYSTPDRVSYSDFDLGFVVDENMNNYIEVFRWMESMGSSESLSQYKNLQDAEDGVKSDISIVVNNNHKNPNIKFTMINCFPISLSSISLSAATQDIQYPECTATFRYDYFTIEKIS